MAQSEHTEEKSLCTEISEIPKMVAELRSNQLAATPTSYSYRISQIQSLIRFLDDNKDELVNAAAHYYGGKKVSFSAALATNCSLKSTLYCTIGSKMSHYLGRLWMVCDYLHNKFENE